MRLLDLFCGIGSLGCPLARPAGAGPREIVCDLDGGIAAKLQYMRGRAPC